MNNQSRSKFWFKPGCLGRHNIAAICYVHKLFHRDRVKSKRHFHLAAINSFLQFSESSYSANKLHPVVDDVNL